jgi:hypothetical protein
MRSHTSFLTATALVAFVACSSAESESDPRLGLLNLGMTREVALRVLGDSTSGDSLANIYRREIYLFKGEPSRFFLFATGAQGGSVAGRRAVRPLDPEHGSLVS